MRGTSNKKLVYFNPSTATATQLTRSGVRRSKAKSSPSKLGFLKKNIRKKSPLRATTKSRRALSSVLPRSTRSTRSRTDPSNQLLTTNSNTQSRSSRRNKSKPRSIPRVLKAKVMPEPWGEHGIYGGQGTRVINGSKTPVQAKAVSQLPLVTGVPTGVPVVGDYLLPAPSQASQVPASQVPAPSAPSRVSSPRRARVAPGGVSSPPSEGVGRARAGGRARVGPSLIMTPVANGNYTRAGSKSKSRNRSRNTSNRSNAQTASGSRQSKPTDPLLGTNVRRRRGFFGQGSVRKGGRTGNLSSVRRVVNSNTRNQGLEEFIPPLNPNGTAGRSSSN